MPVIIPTMAKGQNKAAFGTKLTCPGLVTGLSGKPEMCGASKWTFVEKLGPYRARYRCKVCNKTMQYDFSANAEHPYAVFGKNKWQRIVEHWKQGKGSASL